LANDITVPQLIGDFRQGGLQENVCPEVAFVCAGKIELNVRHGWLQGLIVVEKNKKRRPEGLAREIRVAVGGEGRPVFFHRSRQLLFSCSQIRTKGEKELKLVSDLLIAVEAVRAEATLVTENAEDFTRWRSLLGSARKTLKLFNPSRATQRQDLQ
jgi:hypothetical protein